MGIIDPIMQGKLALFKTVDAYVKEKYDGKEVLAIDSNPVQQGFVIVFLANKGGQVKVTREELNAWVESKAGKEKPAEPVTTTDNH